MKAVFLDRDGVINHNRADYVKSVDEFVMIPRAAEAIRKLNEAGIPVIVVTNQSCVGRGIITEDELKKIHDHMEVLLAKQGAHVDAIYYCPDTPFQESECRKPKEGMLLKAAEEHGIDLNGSWMLGDSESDIEAGRRAGCHTYMIHRGEPLLQVIENVVLPQMVEERDSMENEKGSRKLRLFGSSGIRGVVNREFTPELAIKIGSAVGTKYRRVVIGHDTRVSRVMVTKALIAGLLSAGADVTDIGMVSTPTLAHTASDYDAGIMVTASHNPAPYNGVKLWNPDGMAFDTEQMLEIEDLIFSEKFNRAKWNEIGELKRDENAVDRHIKHIVSRTGKLQREMHIVVDTGCGAASLTTPYLLREMGARVTTLNAQPDGRFPGRDPEPLEKNIQSLINTVKELGADLGIAHDGDGDRMVAVDEKGRYAGGDALLTLFAMESAKKGAVTTVSASMVLEDSLNVPVKRVRVGDVYVAEEMRRLGYDFGGEPTGVWIFAEESYCPDGVFAAAKLAKMVEKKPLSEMLDSIPSYPIRRKNFHFEPEKREGIVAHLKREVAAIKDAVVNSVDGYRIEFEDGWMQMRLSGTEPVIRIASEARSRERADELFAVVEDIVRRGL